MARYACAFPNKKVFFFIAQSRVDDLAPLLGLQRGWRVQPLAMVSPDNQPVAGVYCKSYKRARDIAAILRRTMPLWEADVRPPDRYLMERFIKSAVQIAEQDCTPVAAASQATPVLTQPQMRPAAAGLPSFKVVSLDIETDMRAEQLFSIAVWGEGVKLVFMVHETGELQEATQDDFELRVCISETECLTHFFAWLQSYDPDIIIGWAVIGFDLWVLEKMCRRLQIPYALGRDNRAPSWRSDINDRDKRYITIPGRVALDGIELLRMAFYQFESFSLEFVARSLLGDGKLLKGSGRGEEITRLFAEDKLQLARYNLKDCELVWDIFIATELIAFASAKSQMTGLPLDRIGGSAAAFEFSYLPKLHRLGYVAPSIGDCKIDLFQPRWLCVGIQARFIQTSIGV